MISIFTGVMGSGKTLYAVEIILNSFLRGAVVATNIELNIPAVYAYCLSKGVEFQPEQYIFLNEKKILLPHKHLPPGTSKNPNLLVLDECAILFPSRQWQKTQVEFFAFLLMIRRQFTEVIFICQRIGQIDKQFRDIYQFRWNFNNLSRALTLPVLGFFPFEILFRVQYDQTNERLSYTPGLVHKEIASCYNTYQHVISFERPKLNISVKKISILTRIRNFFKPIKIESSMICVNGIWKKKENI